MTLALAYHGTSESTGGSTPAINEFIRPDGDIANGDIGTPQWSSTPLYAKLDDNSDSDYVISNASTQVWPSYDRYHFECSLGDPSETPATGGVQGIKMRARLGIDQANNFGLPGNADFTFRLKQGSTVIASQTYSTGTLASPSTRTYTLNSTEVNSITDHDDLRFFVTVDIGHASGSPDLEARVFWAEVEYYAL